MKKAQPIILIILFCLTAFLIGARPAYANSAEIVASTIFSVGILGVATIIGFSIYILLFLPAMAILWLAGQIFNFSLFLSLNSGALGKELVTIGWAISRDVANLFFIFILLYISIATILRLSGYGAKELLARLVIVALLVNFSLVFSQAIVDASNILALEFYNSIKVEGGAATIQITGVQNSPQNLSAVIMKGFSPQKIFSSAEFEQVLKGGQATNVVIDTVIKFTLAAIIIFIAAFILLAAAGLFIIRTVILWLIMILAPIAFISMILPATRGIASRWWSALFKQSFFAPAFLFFYYLTAQMINKGFLDHIKTVASVPPATGLEAVLQGSLATFLQFSVLGILLVACLVVAQEMGAHGASAAIAIGKKGAGMAAGYVGQTAARHTIAPLAQRAAASPTMQNIAASFPRLGGAALRTLQQGAKAGGADKVAEQRTATGLSLSPKGRAEYLAKSDKRTQAEMMKKMSARERVEVLENADSAQKSTAERLMKNLPVEEREKTETLRKEREAAVQFKTALTEAKTNPADRGRAEALMSLMTAPQLNKIMDEKGENLTAIFEVLKNFGADLKTATQNIAKINPSLAGHIASQPRMQRTFRLMFGEQEAPKV